MMYLGILYHQLWREEKPPAIFTASRRLVLPTLSAVGAEVLVLVIFIQIHSSVIEEVFK